jgi:hypothetical protein
MPGGSDKQRRLLRLEGRIFRGGFSPDERRRRVRVAFDELMAGRDRPRRRVGCVPRGSGAQDKGAQVEGGGLRCHVGGEGYSYAEMFPYPRG